MNGQTPGPEPHPYYPLRAGLEWEYRTTVRYGGSELPSAKSRERVSEVRVDNGQLMATVSTQYDYNKDASATHRVTINRDGLSPDPSPMGTAAGTVQAGGVQGVLLPRDPQPGQRWTYTMQFDTAQQIYKINATVEAMAVELIEVPAGRFNAIRLVSTTKTRITAKTPFTLPNGIEPPAIDQSQVEETYWARGVGRIKTVSRAATGYETTVELSWYSPG